MLEKLYGIDVELGMSYCLDDEDCYLEILGEYVKSAKIDDLCGFFESKDWANYRILIHAVKSTSMTIGAKELSDKALALEIACKDGNEEYILNNHEDCMAMYRNVMKTITEAIN